MNVNYNELNLEFSIGGKWFQASNLIQGPFQKPVPCHSHGAGSFEIHYIASGYGIVCINDIIYEIGPGTLFVTGPLVRHSQIPQKKDPMYEFCIYLKEDMYHKEVPCQSYEEELFVTFVNTTFWFGTDVQQTGALIKEIFEELEGRQVGYLTQAELLLKSLIIKLVRCYKCDVRMKKIAVKTSIAEKSAVIIEEYFLYEFQSLNLTELANRLNLSPRQTERLLMKCYGKTFSQKKAEARMSAAVFLLSEENSSISIISEKLGYSSAEHFTAAFKRYYGHSPSEYRKHNNLNFWV